MKKMTSKEYKALRYREGVTVQPTMGHDSHKMAPKPSTDSLTRIEHKSPYIQAHNTVHVEYKKA